MLGWQARLEPGIPATPKHVTATLAEAAVAVKRQNPSPEVRCHYNRRSSSLILVYALYIVDIMSEPSKIGFFEAAMPLWSPSGWQMLPLGWPREDVPVDPGADSTQLPEPQAPTVDEAVLRFQSDSKAAAAEKDEPVIAVDLSLVRSDGDEDGKSRLYLCFNSRRYGLLTPFI